MAHIGGRPSGGQERPRSPSGRQERPPSGRLPSEPAPQAPRPQAPSQADEPRRRNLLPAQGRAFTPLTPGPTRQRESTAQERLAGYALPVLVGGVLGGVFFAFILGLQFEDMGFDIEGSQLKFLFLLGALIGASGGASLAYKAEHGEHNWD